MAIYKIEIGKTGDVLDVDWDAIPAQSKRYVILYGLKQTLSDCITSVKRADFAKDKDFLQEARAGVDARLARIMDGNPPAMGTRATDPIAKRMKLLATDFVARQMPGVKGAEKRKAVSDVMADNADTLRATATKQLVDEQGMAITLPKGLASK